MKLKDVFEEVFNQDNKLNNAINKTTTLGNEYAKSQQELSNLISQAQEESKNQKIEAEKIKKEKEQLDKEKAKFNDMVKQEQIKKAQEQAVAQAQNQAKQVSTQVDLAAKEK